MVPSRDYALQSWLPSDIGERCGIYEKAGPSGRSLVNWSCVPGERREALFYQGLPCGTVIFCPHPAYTPVLSSIRKGLIRAEPRLTPRGAAGACEKDKGPVDRYHPLYPLNSWPVEILYLVSKGTHS